MSYKTELQSNNTDLQSILDTVNALPDAESGGSTVSVTVTNNSGDGNSILYFTESGDGATISNGEALTVSAYGGIFTMRIGACTSFTATGSYKTAELDGSDIVAYIFLEDGGTLTLGDSMSVG